MRGSTPGRRAVLGLAATGLAAPRIAGAQDAWPSRPVRYICPYAAGGPTDTLSRQFCQKMSEVTGGLPGSTPETLEGAAEFDADLEDLVRLVENSAAPTSRSTAQESAITRGGE